VSFLDKLCLQTCGLQAKGNELFCVPCESDIVRPEIAPDRRLKRKILVNHCRGGRFERHAVVPADCNERVEDTGEINVSGSKVATMALAEARCLGEIRRSLIRYPKLRNSLVVTSPSVIRAAVWQAGAARRARDTVTSLYENHPRFSAFVVFHGHQGFYAGIAVSVIVAGLMVSEVTQLLLHIFLSMLNLAALLLRAGAVVRPRHKRQPLPTPHNDVPRHYPFGPSLAPFPSKA
jgi:hypothetical protein